MGTETAGSIRAPAAWNGVAGLCPTVGLVSRRGVLPLSSSLDSVGPIAWTVRDCGLLLAGMVSSDPEDRQRPGFRGPDRNRMETGVAGLRIGVARTYFEGDPDVDPQVLAATERSLDMLVQLGARLGSVTMGDFDRYSNIARAVAWPEEYEAHQAELELVPERFTAVSRERLLTGRDFTVADYIRARRAREAAIAEFYAAMADMDVLVLPTMKVAALPIGFEFGELGRIEVSLTRPFNLMGVPALALCNGFTGSGLPISIQIVGRHFDEDVVLQVGQALEAALDLRDRRPAIAVEDHTGARGSVG